MLDILSITSPIYVLILIGYLMTRLGVFGKAEMRILGKFVMTLALPALLFRSLAQREIVEIFNTSYLLAYLSGSLLVIVLGFLWWRKVAGLDTTTSSVRVMGMVCSNSGYVGYPIVLLTLAPVAGVALALNVLVENLVVLPLLLTMAETKGGASGRWTVVKKSFARLLKTPLILGLIAGLFVALLGWRLPEPILRTVDMLAATCSALALFVVGGTLVGLPMRSMGREVAPVTFGKLVLHPLAVFLAIVVLSAVGMSEIDPSLRMAAVMMAAMPMLGIYPTLAQRYGQEDFSAVALLVTTIASFFTLSALLWLFKHFPFAA